jgi:hypothetical protein
MVKIPQADRIYTVTEGRGITAALCGGNPCSTDAPLKQTPNEHRPNNLQMQ